MRRLPEPEELMDDAAQALAYASADFADANQRFVALLEDAAGRPLRGRLLDLGCGPADIPLLLAQRHPALHLDAVDGAQAMLDLARHRLGAAGEAGRRVQLHCLHLPCSTLPASAYDYLVSNSLLHHLRDPAVIWQAAIEHARPGAQILVMDLARPASQLAVDALVETYALDEPEVLRRDFRNSLIAAYTVDEVQQQLHAAGLYNLEVDMVSDRHLAVHGRMPG